MEGANLRDWHSETRRLIELCYASFRLSSSSLPTRLPLRVVLSNLTLTFDSPSHVERIEIEIANAFFLRLKGIIEFQLRSLGVPNDAWMSGTTLLDEIRCRTGGGALELEPEDVDRLGQFCSLRNIIAHHDGRVVGARAHRLGVQNGTDVWQTTGTLDNWFALVFRLLDAIERSTP